MSMLSVQMQLTTAELKSTTTTIFLVLKSSMPPTTLFSTSSQGSDHSSSADLHLPDLENGPVTGVEIIPLSGLTCTSRFPRPSHFLSSEFPCSASTLVVSTEIQMKSSATVGCNFQHSSHFTETTILYLQSRKSHIAGHLLLKQAR